MKQGCCLLLTLFKIYIQEDRRIWTSKCAGMGIKIEDALLLEDVTYIDHNQWRRRPLIHGLKINRGIRKMGYQDEFPEKYKYFDSIISQERNSEEDIATRTMLHKRILKVK